MSSLARLGRNFVNKISYTHSLRVPSAHLHGSRICAAKKMTEEFEPEQPVKYTTSKAHDYSSFETFEQPKRDWPWYQPLSLIVSMSVFLLYFCVFREENDLDLEIAKPLYERIPGLEENEIRAAIEYEHRNGRDTSALRQRLLELQKQEKLQTAS